MYIFYKFVYFIEESKCVLSLVPPMFTESPTNQTIPKGQSASFPCSATGDPAPSIKWHRSGDLINNDAHFIILPNGTLLVNSVTEHDSGWFACSATNEAGTREAKAYLLVAGKEIVKYFS